MSVMTTGPKQNYPAYQEAYQEVDEVKSWTRWQDWASLLLGLMLWVCPGMFVGFTGTSDASASITVIIAGTVIAGVSVWALSEPHVRELQGIIAVTSVWLILTPMMFGFMSSEILQTLLHWAAGTIGVVLSLWTLMNQAGRITTKE